MDKWDSFERNLARFTVIVTGAGLSYILAYGIVSYL